MPSIIPINREEILELTRRMTLSRTSMTRIAGSYMDSEGFIDGTFNTNFLKLKAKREGKKSCDSQNNSIFAYKQKSETIHSS